MKVKVKETFRDRDDHVTEYKPGMVLEVKDEARAKSLLERGLATEFKGNKAAEAVLGGGEAADGPAAEQQGTQQGENNKVQ